MVDIYFKNSSDISYNVEELEDSTEIGIIISQIKMLLFTNKGEVLGNTRLGLNLENIIFETNVSKEKILSILKEQMFLYLVYDDVNYKIDYDLDFYKGTVRDIAVLKIKINNKTALDVFIK